MSIVLNKNKYNPRYAQNLKRKKKTRKLKM